METILSYALSFVGIFQEIGKWTADNPTASSILGGLVVNLAIKYSPWRGTNDLLDILGGTIKRAGKR